MRRAFGTIMSIVVTLLVSILVLPNLGLRLDSTLIVSAMVVALLIGQTSSAIGAAVGCGLVLDLVDPVPFGTHLLTLTVVAASTIWLSYRWLTNRSAISFLTLIGLGMLFERTLRFALAWMGRWFDPGSIAPTLDRRWMTTTVWDMLVAIALGISVLLIVRSTGRSYATLSQRSF